MLTKNDVITILKREQPFLKKNFGVKKIAIFGSFANNTASQNSDVDILLEFKKPLGLKFIHLTDYLDSKLGRKTDILTKAGIESIRIKKVAEKIRRSIVYV
ncbi:MAG: nucleotidyltransferase family protein [Candidatus Omnitrophica bacterium]|nr:nucleotidyltransferase family protein [Candidatus Omnitrophota bacterium]